MWPHSVAAVAPLDYVAAWFIRASEYVRQARSENSTRPPRIGFVATNSITQGEQVAQLWPLLLDRHRSEIAFAPGRLPGF